MLRQRYRNRITLALLESMRVPALLMVGGADLVLADLNAEGLERTAADVAAFGRRAVPMVCNMSNPTEITGLFDLRGGAVLSFMLLFPALAVFLLQRYWVSRRYYVTVTGKGAGRNRVVHMA